MEIQGTGEDGTFDREQLNSMLEVAEKGLKELIEIQQEVLRAPYPGELP